LDEEKRLRVVKVFDCLSVFQTYLRSDSPSNPFQFGRSFI